MVSSLFRLITTGDMSAVESFMAKALVSTCKEDDWLRRHVKSVEKLVRREFVGLTQRNITDQVKLFLFRCFGTGSRIDVRARILDVF
jgi:hypothetical protein